MRLVAIAALMVLLAGCSSARNTGSAPAQVVASAAIVGDENGGKIPDGVANSNNAYGSATAHCKSFGKKAFITKWDSPSDRGAIVFECK
jgi:hypothetical protein